MENDPKYDTLLGSKGGVFCGKQNSTEYKDRCGYGPRLPLIIISPYSKVNYDIQRS
jgi:phospholipase C